MPGSTPYVNSAMLLARPLGVSWTIVPSLSASDQAQQAQIDSECQAATSAVDRYCRQPLRAVITTEQMPGPGMPRFATDRISGRTTLITRRWPVASVAAIQYALNPPWGTYPLAWHLVPAGQWNIRNPVLQAPAAGPPSGPSGGNVIDIATGFTDWLHGKGGWTAMVSYQSGFGAHTSLTAAAAKGATTLAVDDVTGWASTGGWLYDAASTELAQVTAVAAASPVQLPGVAGTVQAGPGTLTLAAPLAYSHQPGAVISALPADIIRATALQATVQAIEGIDAIATQSVSGARSGGSGELATEVEMILDDYRRVA